MPYFKTPDGGKGHVSDEEVMSRLEKQGFVRLKGKELFLRIVWNAMKKWGIPAVFAVIANHFTQEFMVGLIVFAGVQQILD